MEGGRKGDREGGANQVLKYEIKELRKKGRMREGREKEGEKNETIKDGRRKERKTERLKISQEGW